MALSFVATVRARSITDMAGRSMTVPDRIERVVSFDPKTNAILFPVAGELMVARGMSGSAAMHGGGAANMKYISDKFLNTKAIDANNIEEIMRMKPDIVIIGVFLSSGANVSRYQNMSERSQIPFVIIDLDLEKLDDSLIFLGELLDKEDIAVQCADFVRTVYSIAADCRNMTPLQGNVYLATRSAGLISAPANTTHTQVFALLNIPVVTKGELNAQGFTTVSIEQVIAWNPDYIFCLGSGESNPYRHILKSGIWRGIRAVKQRQIYSVPSDPYPWIDMPPSVNRIPGIIWLANIFYGRQAEQTMQDITTFYRLFYQYELTEKEYKKLIINYL